MGILYLERNPVGVSFRFYNVLFFIQLHGVGSDRFTLPLALPLYFPINFFSFQQSDKPKTKFTEDVTADKARISRND
jgi:hypothetical protein